MLKHLHAQSAQVRLNNVSVHYYSKAKWLGGKPYKALNELSLSIDKKNLAIVGPSGAGKSTLIELLFSLKKPSLGEVYICGHALSKISAKHKQALCQHIQLIPQEPQSALNPYYTVEQILTEPLLNTEFIHQKSERVRNALLDVGLDSSLLTQNSQALSVGQAQRLAIARALIIQPCVLVADEPTSSLDPVSREQIISLFLSLQKSKNMRLILVTHDLNAAMGLTDEILVLHQGEVVEHDSVNNLVTKPKHSITKKLLNSQRNMFNLKGQPCDFLN